MNARTCLGCDGRGWHLPTGLDIHPSSCVPCDGSGQVTDRITVQDALADAETLVPYLKPRVAAVLDRGRDAMYSLGLAISWARQYQSEYYDVQAEIKGRQRGRVAFVACPGLRG